MDINLISGQVVDAAMKVHSALGPGLLESAYEVCLAHELRKYGLLINFNMLHLRDGIKRRVMNL